MWVKRTEAEIAQEQRRQRRSRLWATAGVSGVILVICLFVSREAFRRGHVFVPADQLLSRLPFAILAGIISGFVFWKWERVRPTMICPDCEVTKYEDGVIDCPCGGHFEKMDMMKYVA